MFPDVEFDTTQVSKFAKVSLRQLQWWDEQGVVRPRREGHRRLYHASQVARVLLIAELRKRGLALNRMAHLLKGPVLKQIEERRVGERFLVGNSKAMYIIDSRSELVDDLKRATVPLFVLSVPDVLQPLTAAMQPAVKNGTAPARGKRK